MLDEEVQAVILAIVVVAAVFAISQYLAAGRVVEPFSELGLLGPNKKIGDYPKEVLVNESINLYLYIGNHEGRSIYYIIYGKLGNKSTFINETVPADAPTIARYEVLLPNDYNETIPVNITVPSPGTNYRLIFEMWVLNETTMTPQYHGRWVQLWINVTSPTP